MFGKDCRKYSQAIEIRRRNYNSMSKRMPGEQCYPSRDHPTARNTPPSDLPPRLSGRSSRRSARVSYRHPEPWAAETLLFSTVVRISLQTQKNQPTNCKNAAAALQRSMHTCCLGVGFGGLKGHLAAPTRLPALEKRTSARDTARAKDDMKCRSALCSCSRRWR